MVLRLAAAPSNHRDTEWPVAITATQELTAGSCLLIEAPFANITTAGVCARCHKIITRSILYTTRRRPCSKCNLVTYCCKKCKLADEEIHSAHCEAYKMSTAFHRKLSQPQEELAVLTAQCLSRVFSEAEREGICGIHVLLQTSEARSVERHTEVSRNCSAEIPRPDTWLYDLNLIRLLRLTDAPPVELNTSVLLSDMRGVMEHEFLPETTNTLEFLSLVAPRHLTPRLPPGWAHDAVVAAVSICDCILRRWVCTCGSPWSNSLEDKVAVVSTVIKVIQNYGLISEIRFPEAQISTLAPDEVPGSGVGSRPRLDRRRSGSLGDTPAVPPDPFVPKMGGSSSLGAYGVYPKVALLEHSCQPNCFAYLKQNRAVVVALRSIHIGERITVAKCSLLLPRHARRNVLQNRFGFRCACARCANRGLITLEDVYSIARDLAAVIPDEELIREVNQDAAAYLNVDEGMCSTRDGAVVLDLDCYAIDEGVHKCGGGASSTPETEPADELFSTPPAASDADAKSAIAVLSNLMATLKHQTSARSYDAICNATAGTLESRLNPLSLHLYNLRKRMRGDWRAVAKQLIFLSFVYKDCETHLDRLELLHQLGELLKRDFNNLRYSIRARLASNRTITAGGASQAPLSGAGSTKPQRASSICRENAANEREVFCEVLRCIFREVEFGYRTIFGEAFSRTKQAATVLNELPPK